MAKLVTEAVGTYFLVLLILLTGNPIAIGLGLTALVYMGGHISGAHYNPAVTLTFLLRGRVDVGEAIRFVLVQLVGAILAAATAAYLVRVGTVEPAPQAIGQAYVTEILFTFLLVIVILNVADAPGTKGNSYYGVAIGFVITGAAFAGGKISGGAYNPAVGIGPNLFAVARDESVDNHVWLLYTVGPVVGALLATLVFSLQMRSAAPRETTE
ncbi:MAG: aquaporin [Planctomycetota bacterium]